MRIMGFIVLLAAIPFCSHAQFFEWSKALISLSSQSSVGLSAGSYRIDYNGAYLLQTNEQPCRACTQETWLHKIGNPKSWSKRFSSYSLWNSRMYGDSAGNTFYLGNFNGNIIIGGISTSINAEGDTCAYIKFDTSGAALWGFTRVLKSGCVDYSGNSYLINNDSLYLLDNAGQALWQRNTGGNYVISDTSGNYYTNDSTYTLKKFDAPGNLQWQLSTQAKSFSFDKMGSHLFVYNTDSIRKVDLRTGLYTGISANHAKSSVLIFDSKENYYGYTGLSFRKYNSAGMLWQFSLSPFGGSYGLDKNDNLYFLFHANYSMTYDVFIPPALSLYNDPNDWRGAFASIIGYKISNDDSIQNGIITTGNVKALCVKGTMDVPFTYNKYYVQYVDSGFNVELSDSSGSFSFPIVIGTGKKSPISCSVPYFNLSGSSYHVRVVSRSFPKITGSVSAPLPLASPPVISLLFSNYLFNSVACNPAKIVVEPNGPFSYQWWWKDYGTSFYKNIFSTLPFVSVINGYGESYKVTVTDTLTNCPTSQYQTQVYTTSNQTPYYFRIPLKDTICVEDGPFSLKKLTLHGDYSGAGVNGQYFYPDSAGYGWHSVKYTTYDTVSCYPPDTSKRIFVDSCFSKIKTMLINGGVKNRFCQGDTLTVDFNYDTSYFSAGTYFYLQLSNSSGDFYPGQYILDSATTSPVRAVISTPFYQGNNFRVRIITKSPLIYGTANYGGKLEIFTLPEIYELTASDSITTCALGPRIKLNAHSYYTAWYIWHHDSITYTDTSYYYNNLYDNYYHSSTSEFLTSSYGKYWVELVSLGGCRTITDTILITDTLSPVTATLTASPNPFCSGDSANIVLLTDTSNSVQWLYGNNPITPDNPYNFYSYPWNGRYEVQITNKFNCRLKLPLYITDLRPLGATIYSPNNTHSICQDDSIRLSVFTTGLDSWQWYKNGLPYASGFPLIYSGYIKDSGSFTVQVKDTNGCRSTTAPFEIYQRPKPVVTVSSDSLYNCISNPFYTFQVQPIQAISANGTPPYQWFLTYNNIYLYNMYSSVNQVSFIVKFDKTGYYSLSVNDSFCTSLRDSVFNSAYNIPDYSLYTNDPTAFCIGDSALIQSRNGVGENYSWYLDSTLLTSGTNSFVTAYSQGNYYLILSDSFCVVPTNIISITTPCSVGIDEVKNETGLAVFPNPAAEILTVAVNFYAGKKYLTITDVIGKIVFEESFIENKKRLDIRQIIPGLYFVKLQTEKGTLSVKFIKID